VVRKQEAIEVKEEEGGERQLLFLTSSSGELEVKGKNLIFFSLIPFLFNC
jgi:hypothetical protein